MNQATIAITINQFRTMGGIFPVSATMVLGSGAPAAIQLSHKNLTIQGQAQITFTLADANHTLIGVAFNLNSTDHQIGLNTFPTINASRSQGSSSLVVTDNNPNPNASYNYVILVQSLRTGELGLIDPGIENEPGS